MASNEPAQAASSSIAERTGTPSSIPSPAYRPLNAVSQLEPQEPGFYVVPQSTTREALEADLFPIRNAAVMSKFRALNPYVAEVKAGSMMVLSDPNNTTCSYQEAQLMQAANQVNSALEPLTSEEANFLFKHGAEIASFIGETSTWLGVSAVIMEKHLGNLRGTLQAIERLHQESYRRHGNLKSPQFLSERQQLLAKLDSHLLNSTRLRGQTSLGDHPKLKTAPGISSRSLVHHWSKAGAPGQIPGYATHVDKVSRAAKYMNTGGFVAIGIGGISSLLAIQQVCNGDSGAGCRKIKFTEGGKFGGSAVGGLFAGEVAKLASARICIALGISTGIGGVMCAATIIGVGAWAGATSGGMLGEGTGEVIYERISR